MRVAAALPTFSAVGHHVYTEDGGGGSSNLSLFCEQDNTDRLCNFLKKTTGQSHLQINWLGHEV